MAEIITELDLLIAEREHVEAVAAAKQTAQANPGDADAREAFRVAKLAHRELKFTWRTIRHDRIAAAVAGDAAALAALLGPGDAIAAPAPHAMGITPQEGN